MNTICTRVTCIKIHVATQFDIDINIFTRYVGAEVLTEAVMKSSIIWV